MKRRTLILLLVGVLIGVGLGALILLDVLPGFGSDAVVVGKRAPNFSLSTSTGEIVRLEDMRGKAVALNFWATWCPPCKAEMPLLQATAETYADKMVVLGVNLDESPELVAQFATERAIAFPLLLDPGGEVNLRYQVSGYPTTVFIDADGVVRGRHIGQLLPNALEFYLTSVGVLN